MSETSLYLTVTLGDCDVLLRLDPDPARERRALARLGPFALSYLDHALPPELHAGLPELTRRCARLGPDATEREAVAALAGAVAVAWPDALLRRWRRVAAGQVIPRWPVSLRSGAPEPGAGRLWPYDAELMGVLLGRRRLVLREWDSDPAASSDQAWLRSHGLHLATMTTPDGTIAQLAAPTAALAREASGTLREAWAQGPGQAAAARWMGEALGYPSCCVARFTRRRARDERTLLADHLPPWDLRRRPPLGNWLIGALTLLSYAPCSPDCPATSALAAAVLDGLDSAYPGFADLWNSHAYGLHLLDESGRALVLRATGSLATGVTVQEARVIRAMDGRPEPGITVEAGLAGATLQVEEMTLVDEEGRVRAGLVGDWREDGRPPPPPPSLRFAQEGRRSERFQPG